MIDDYTVSCDVPLNDPGPATVTVINSKGTDVRRDGYLYTPAVVVAGDTQPGGTITVSYYCDPGDTIFAVYGLPPKVSIPTPPFDGELCIWPYFKFFAAISWPTGTWYQSFALPPDPSLSDVQVLLQALIGPSFKLPKDAAWTNAAVLEID